MTAFFHFKITDLTALSGKHGETLRTLLAETGSDIEKKLHLLQDFLLKQLEKNPTAPVYDYCIQRITASRGLATVAQL